MVNTSIIGRIYHVVDKTTGEVVKVGSTIQTLAKRFGTGYKRKHSNHFLREVRIIQSGDFDWYKKGDSYCPFLWHLVTAEHIEMLAMDTFRKGPLSNQESPLDQKFRGFDGSEYGRIGALATSRETRVRGGITTGQRNAASGYMSKLGKNPLYRETHVQNGRIAGRKRVESGFFSSEHQSKVGRISGKISGRKNAESGHCARIAGLGGHTRWHVKKGVISKSCGLCKVS